MGLRSGARRRAGKRVLLTLAACVIVGAPGCVAAALVGGMARSAQRQGSHEVYAEYEGLKGKTFAAVVATDRSIEAQYPGLSARLMARINGMISEAHAAMPDGATAGPRVDRMLRVLYNHPEWPALPREDVAKLLGVERLIIVDLSVYRLNEPGNAHLWDGTAAGTVSVIEADSTVPSEAVFERAINVTFPDSTGYMVTDIARDVVHTELSNRFANRAAWLFFDHKEKNEMEY